MVDESIVGDGVPVSVKIKLLTDDLQMWRNTVFLSRMRHKVNAKIGSDPAILKQLEDEMVKAEGAIEILTEELRSLVKEAKDESPGQS